MTCFKPLGGVKSREGRVEITSFTDPDPAYSSLRVFPLPCGQCRGCRRSRQRDYAVRAVHESQCHKYEHGYRRGTDMNSFVTLTYSDEHLPKNGSLRKSDFTSFAKRLREYLGPFRYMHCGEYGEKYKRPHFHCLLFGIDFDFDRKQVAVRDGFPIYRSRTLDGLWPYGSHEIGGVSVASASYVAKYIVEGLNGEQAREKYGERVAP